MKADNEPSMRLRGGGEENENDSGVSLNIRISPRNYLT
jgi:hypothetical protein